jgi:hypothetical protein
LLGVARPASFDAEKSPPNTKGGFRPRCKEGRGHFCHPRTQEQRRTPAARSTSGAFKPAALPRLRLRRGRSRPGRSTRSACRHRAAIRNRTKRILGPKVRQFWYPTPRLRVARRSSCRISRGAPGDTPTAPPRPPGPPLRGTPWRRDCVAAFRANQYRAEWFLSGTSAWRHPAGIDIADSPARGGALTGHAGLPPRQHRVSFCHQASCLPPLGVCRGPHLGHFSTPCQYQAYGLVEFSSKLSNIRHADALLRHHNAFGSTRVR